MSNRPLKRILMVEDEPDIRTIAKFALEAVGGFTVELCASGSEAIEKAVAFAPDLLLLDVMIAGMDGPTTFKTLRAMPQTAHTPAIFMTAKVQRHEVEQYKQLGAIDVIAKPFDPMALSAMIHQIWEQADV